MDMFLSDKLDDEAMPDLPEEKRKQKNKTTEDITENHHRRLR